MITRDNYEVYFVDYFDGKLSSEEIEGLLRFLSGNSDLEEEFYALLEMSPEADLKWSDFAPETVKRDSRADFELSTFDYLCIADVENEIAVSDKKILSDSVAANTKLKHDLDLYKKTKLPDEVIVFPRKEALKKNVFEHRRTRRIISYSSIAAAVTLVMLFAMNERQNLGQVAQNQPAASSAPKQSAAVDPSLGIKAAERVVYQQDKRVITEEQAATAAKTAIGSQPISADDNVLASVASADTAMVEKSLFVDKEMLQQIAYNSNVTLESSIKISIDVTPVSQMTKEEQERTLLASLQDFEIVNSVNSLVSKGNTERTELANTITEYRGRKKGVLVARFINGVNTIFGTSIEYSSKYTVDGKLVALDIQAGKLTYGKKNDSAK